MQPTTGLGENSIEASERPRVWAADDRLAPRLPPLPRRHTERLLQPRSRGRKPLPSIVLAAFAIAWGATAKPRGKPLAGRFGMSEATVRKWAYRARERGFLDGDRPSGDARLLLGRSEHALDAIVCGWLLRGFAASEITSAPVRDLRP